MGGEAVKNKLIGTEFDLTPDQAAKLEVLFKHCEPDITKPAGAIFMQPHDYISGDAEWVTVHAVYLPALVADKIKRTITEWKRGKP